jgi:hypothetical protein
MHIHRSSRSQSCFCSAYNGITQMTAIAAGIILRKVLRSQPLPVLGLLAVLLQNIVNRPPPPPRALSPVVHYQTLQHTPLIIRA